MLGVHCLQDLKKKLRELGIEVKESHGWYLITPQGSWGMSLGELYLNDFPIQSLANLEEFVAKNPPKKQQVIEPKAAKSASADSKKAAGPLRSKKKLTAKSKKRKVTHDH